MYEKLFGEQFNAHDSLKDVVALGRVLHSNKLQQTLEGMVASARQANTFCEDIAMKEESLPYTGWEFPMA